MIRRVSNQVITKNSCLFLDILKKVFLTNFLCKIFFMETVQCRHMAKWGRNQHKMNIFENIAMFYTFKSFVYKRFAGILLYKDSSH